MTFGLVDVGYSLPEGQAVKLIFFAPCCTVRLLKNVTIHFKTKTNINDKKINLTF